jgi:triosephosphate isomerase
MLFDFGATWTLVGHSERRRDPLVAETDEVVALKARHATAVGLSVVACVGESAGERDAGHGIKVVTRQLETLAKEIAYWDAVVIAYEPLWAIGTGHIASLEHVQEARPPWEHAWQHRQRRH